MTTHPLPLRSVGARSHARTRPAARPRRFRAWALFVVIVVGAFFGLTYSRTSLDHSAIHLDGLEDAIAEAQAHHFDLRVQVAEMRDPRRIADAAAGLGLVYPDEWARLVVARAPAADEPGPEERWAQLKSLLAAQPRASRP